MKPKLSEVMAAYAAEVMRSSRLEAELAEARRDAEGLDWVLRRCQITTWRESFGGAAKEIGSRADIDAASGRRKVKYLGGEE